MAKIGTYNSLPVLEQNEQGVYLDAGELGAVLLPNSSAISSSATSNQFATGESVKVFLYHNSNDQLVATTEQALGQVGEFCQLKVKQVNNIGAFLDWGLSKDLLVPFSEQKRKMEAERSYLVRIYQDQHTGRVVASSKLDKFINIWPADYQSGQKVELTIATRTDLGFKAIINNLHWGLLYNNEIFQSLRTGQKVTGYIKKLRDDGNIDLSLSRAGKGKVIDFSDQFIQHLIENDGFTAVHDKSSPALIQKLFGVSKKAFKATVGHLLKQNRIVLETNGIRLKQKN